MKKPFVILFAILLLAFISVYFIIPQKIKTTNVVEMDATDVNVSKFLVNKRPWAKWWPGQHNVADSSLYNFNGTDYLLQRNTNSDMQALIKFDGMEVNSQLIYATIGEGSCRVTWFTEMQSSLNPFERVSQFVKTKSLTKDLNTILSGFKKFMQTDTNIYGMKVRVSPIKNPIVLASSTNTHDYPSPKTIYSLVAALKQQISLQHATAVDSPMLNVHPGETDGYQIMVAIPINKNIMPGKNMKINMLVKNGNALEADVTGGKNTIINAFTQLKNYQKAHRLISPAMPFEVLVTNRLAQPDTAKWTTKIFWPIF
ncbi:hypothetical protein ACVW0P_001141 [Mucilaginibacter sp. UYNi724]